jgi:hypothetical protein
MKQNQFELAEQYTKQAVQLAVALSEKFQQPKLLLEPYEQCGVVFFKLKKYKESKEMYMKALGIVNK